MRWQKPEGRQPQPAVASGVGGVPGRFERTSPGLAAFFEGVSERQGVSVLDLGRASGSALSLYSTFARWIQFADLLEGQGRAAPLARTIPEGKQPYDLVLAWDVLDRVREEEREEVVERLALITAPEARLYTVVGASRVDATARPRYRFELRDFDHMALEPLGPGELPSTPLLPAAVQRLLEPFQIVRAFSADIGIREYYAIRSGSTKKPTGFPATLSAPGRTE